MVLGFDMVLRSSMYAGGVSRSQQADVPSSDQPKEYLRGKSTTESSYIFRQNTGPELTLPVIPREGAVYLPDAKQTVDNKHPRPQPRLSPVSISAQHLQNQHSLHPLP